MDEYDAICALLRDQLRYFADMGRPLLAGEAQALLALVQAKVAMEKGK